MMKFCPSPAALILLLQARAFRPLAEQDEADGRLLAHNALGGRHQHVKALLRTETPRRSDEVGTRLAEVAHQLGAIACVGFEEACRIDGVVNDADAIGTHTRATDASRLRLRHADDMIHPAQMETIQPFIKTHLEALGRPSPRHGDGGNLSPTGRQASEQVGLVAVATQHVRFDPFEMPGDLMHRGP